MLPPSTATIDTSGFSQASKDILQNAESLPGGHGSFSTAGNTTTYTAPQGQQAIVVPQPAKEPTALTSGTITDSIIPANQEKLAALSTKGSYQGADGQTYAADGTIIPPATHPETGLPQDTGPIENPENDPAIKAVNDFVTSQRAATDAASATKVAAIGQLYGARIAMQNQLNSGVSGARYASLISGGTLRYARQDASSVLGAQEKVNMMTISNLEAAEFDAIAGAQAAAQAHDQQALDTALKQVDTIRNQKQQALTKLAATVQKQNDKLAAAARLASLADTVTGLMGQGVTKPGDLLKYINEYDDGSTTGANLSATELGQIMKVLQPAAGSDSFKFSQPQLGKLYSSGLTHDQVAALSDYYNGRGDAAALSALPASAQALVHGLLNPAGKGAAGKSFTSGSLHYTPGDITEGHSKLAQSKGADGYVDPDLYLSMAQAWTGGGGAIKDFIKNYPVSSWVNPANTYVVPQINALIKQDAAAAKTTGAKAAAGGRTP